MRITHNPQTRQLSIIASTEAEHFELEEWSAIMKHGDRCAINQLSSAAALGSFIVFFDGKFEYRNDKLITIYFSPDVDGYADSCASLKSFWESVAKLDDTVANASATLFYLWPGETPHGEWNTLVLRHH